MAKRPAASASQVKKRPAASAGQVKKRPAASASQSCVSVTAPGERLWFDVAPGLTYLDMTSLNNHVQSAADSISVEEVAADVGQDSDFFGSNEEDDWM